MCKLNTLLNNQWFKDDIQREIKNYLERNKNRKTTYQKTWNAAKAVLIGKFTEINASLKKKDNK